MQFTDGENLRNTVLHAPIGICLLNADTLIVELVNDKFLQVAGKPHDAIFGQFYWDAFAEARPYCEAALLNVVETGEAYHADEVELRLIRHGREEMIFVTFVYAPIPDKAGKVSKVAVWVLESTLQVKERQKVEAARAAFQRERDRLNGFFMQAPAGICILSGPELVYELVNPKYQELLPGRTLLHRPIFEALPELIGTPLQEVLSAVYRTGESRCVDELLIPLAEYTGEPASNRYFSFNCQARRDENDAVDGIMAFVFEVTAMKKVQQVQRTLNEELAATNEEQAASNEELTAMNEELAVVNDRLLAAQQRIEESETALRLAINAANFGTWFIHSVTREFITDARLKELFGYHPDEDLSIEQALAQIPEEYRGIVSGKLENAIYNNGDYDVTYPVIGLHDNRLRWLRAIGNLKADPSGAFSAFTGVVMDITEQHLAAQKIAQAEESLRMAVDAAGLGTYSINAADRILQPSPRLKEFFGFRPDEEVSYEAVIHQIHPDYRQKIADMVEAAFTTGQRFEMEYPVIGREGSTVRWLRSMGTMQHYEGKDFFTGVLHDITERKEDEMRKNDFIGMVSHELKTPLTSLNAIIQVANSKLKNSDDQFLATAMEKANQQLKRMSTMINGFLDISRLESGKILIEKEHFDIEELVREIADEASLIISTHKLSLALCRPVEVYADRDKINSVISNLISNAVKYSLSDTTIHVACEADNTKVTIRVRDEGIGISRADADKIFERYYRVDNSSTRHISGFGIGLYLSKEIVEHHGGTIWLESEPGRGSTFCFSLPIHKQEKKRLN